MKTRIQYVKNKIMPGGYVGMNSRAARSLRIPFYHKKPEHTIVIWKGLNKNEKEHTIKHERIELDLMKRKHYSYQKAHKIALKEEKK